MVPTASDSPETGPAGRDPQRRRGGVPSVAAKWTCWVAGTVFVLMAILGFAGHDRLLGAFTINLTHSGFHLISGIVLLGLGFTPELIARRACWVFAVINGMIAILGFAGVMWLIQLLNLNVAGLWLYFVLAVVLVAGGGLSHAQEQARLRTAAPEPGIHGPSR